jgi:hypothetical protein
LQDVEGTFILESYDADTTGLVERSPGRYAMTTCVPARLLNSGRFLVGVNAGIPMRRNLANMAGAVELTIENAPERYHLPDGVRRGFFYLHLKWQNEVVE